MGDLEKISVERKKLSQYILGNARTLIIVFILFSVIVFTTTDISRVTISDIGDLGLDFFLLLFSSYAMYICCFDGGTNAALVTDVYKDSVKRFAALKEKVLENSRYCRLNEFCAYYIAEDLKKARMHHLLAASIDYSEYLKKYVKLSKNELKECKELTELQRKAINKANRVRQIRFNPDMMTSDHSNNMFARFALTITPRMQKNITFSTKFVKMCAVALGVTLISFKIIVEPSWMVFAEVCTKLFTVVFNGFNGRYTGYNNIVVSTVNYTTAQSDLMHQAIQYIDSHPVPSNV